APDCVRAVHVVHLEPDHRDQVRLREQSLRIAEPDESIGGVVLIEPGVEDARNPECPIARYQPQRRDLTLRADHLDRLSDFGTDGLGQIFANDDRWDRTADLLAR